MTRRAQKAKRRHTRRKHTHKRSSKRSSKRSKGGAVYDPMKYDTITVRYFQNLDLPALVQANLMDRLHLDLKALSSKVQEALQISIEQMKECVARSGTSIGTEWKKCEGTCRTLITDAVNQEIGSTAFMLKLLADSVIRPDDRPHRLKIGLDPSFYKGTGEEKRGTGNGNSCRLLTGRWKDDAPFLHLVLPKKRGSGANGGLATGSPPKARLIMGFGPSASGKTHWAKTILGRLAQADPLFPEVFFAVDGGLVRESSAVYQLATEMAHCAGFVGFNNLHAGMFVTGDIKKTMEKYLLQESKSNAISLYVPETLGKCEFMVQGTTMPLIRPCEEYLKTFMDITRDDKWIGLLIWQHATAADHGKDAAFLEKYPGAECVGCEESGKAREKSEGKPYEGHVYAQSMKNGRKYMEMAPGGRYEIHNAGRQEGKSIMWDRSVRNPVTEEFSKIMQEVPGIKYVDHRSDLYGPLVPMETYGYTKEGPAVMTKWAANAQQAANKAEGTPEAAAKRLTALRKAENEKAAIKRTAIEAAAGRGETHIERAARMIKELRNAEGVKAIRNAKNATRKNAAMKARSDPTFLAKAKALAMNNKISASVERLTATAETRKTPVKSYNNHVKYIAENPVITTVNTSTIPKKNVANRKTAEDLLRAQQATLPAPRNRVNLNATSQYRNMTGVNALSLNDLRGGA